MNFLQFIFCAMALITCACSTLYYKENPADSGEFYRTDAQCRALVGQSGNAVSWFNHQGYDNCMRGYGWTPK